MPQDLSHFTVYLVGHAHIDLGYRWRWQETVHRVARDTFRGILDMMDEVPEFTFVQSQLALYEAVKQHYPDLFARILERIAEGRWIVADGWCEYDHTMPSGESMIRQHLIGSRYARQALRRAGMIAPWIAPGVNHAMPPKFGFLEVAPDNIVLTAFKLEQEDWGPGSPVIVRLYETAGHAVEATLTFSAPLMTIEETNHLEEPLADQPVAWEESVARVAF
jgi:alpha-mannosidase